MKINIFLKIIFIIFIVFNLTFPIIVEAAKGWETDFSSFDIEKKEGVTVPTTVKTLTNGTLGTAISVVRIAGTGIAIVTLMVIACKYMMAAPGDRADIKKHAVPYVIGAVVLFGTTGLLGIIADIATLIKL